MKLKVISKPNLTLTKEKKTYDFGEEFEVSDKRGVEILRASFAGKPVVEYVDDNESLKKKIDELTNENKKLVSHIELLEKNKK